MDELRVALLRNWANQGFDFPVYGVLDADELEQEGKTTLAIDGGRWCVVVPDDVRVVPSVPVREAVTEGWLDEGY
ncbi:hypothetical protein [Bordetella genomosp. 10]|nr:hypothetical protein [Bordetella genomosp. 10]